MVTPICDKCGRPMAWRQRCTDFGARVHGYRRSEVAHFGCPVVHGYWNKHMHSGRTGLRILHAVRVDGFWISSWRAVREVERCPVVHSEPAVHRGSDLRRARSASASVRQFSHRASNLLSSSSSSSARSPAERSFRSLRISCMCFASTLDNSLREKCGQRLQGLEPWGPESATRHVPRVGHTLWCSPGYLCINLLVARRIE
jgi:hypothetical protein